MSKLIHIHLQFTVSTYITSATESSLREYDKRNSWLGRPYDYALDVLEIVKTPVIANSCPDTWF